MRRTVTPVTRLTCLVALAAAAVGCSSPRERAQGPPAAASRRAPEAAAESTPASAAAPGVAEIACPAGNGSGEPSLSVSQDGEALLSWIEPAPDGAKVLQLSTLGPEGWRTPRSVVSSADMLANWADVPRVASGGGGALVAAWLALQGKDAEGYDTRVQVSRDGGATWTVAISPHRDGTATEHGFPIVLPRPEGSADVLWLDGRAYASAGGDLKKMVTALRWSHVGAAGTPEGETVLDARTCDCCPTAGVRTRRGAVVAYRGRSDDEVRDIRVVRLVDGAWTAPATVHADGWKVAGCPVNGPSLATDGSRVALAWFTAPDDQRRVSFAFSADEGASFGPPVRVDTGSAIGRTAVALLEDGQAVVAWIEGGAAGAHLMARRVADDGTLGAPLLVAAVEPGRASGMPHLARDAHGLVAAWTERVGEVTRVRTARIHAG
jgi:hypothetical protein